VIRAAAGSRPGMTPDASAAPAGRNVEDVTVYDWTWNAAAVLMLAAGAALLLRRG
jgi:hypothetical protein